MEPSGIVLMPITSTEDVRRMERDREKARADGKKAAAKAIADFRARLLARIS